MSVSLSNAAKEAVKEVLGMIDDGDWEKVYKEFLYYAVMDSNRGLIITDIGDITRFFIDDCKINPLEKLTVIPAYYLVEDLELTEYIVPDQITAIKQSAFQNCINLTKVIIPESVTRIEDRAFCGCNKLTYITYLGTKAQWYNIYKGSRYWQIPSSKTYTVHCQDGDIKIATLT